MNVHSRSGVSAESYDEEQVHIIQAKVLETHVQSQLTTSVVSCPHLSHDHDIFPLDTRCERLLEAFADLMLVAVAVCAVDEPVSASECMDYCLLDLARLGLPCS